MGKKIYVRYRSGNKHRRNAAIGGGVLLAVSTSGCGDSGPVVNAAAAPGRNIPSARGMADHECLNSSR